MEGAMDGPLLIHGEDDDREDSEEEELETFRFFSGGHFQEAL